MVITLKADEKKTGDIPNILYKIGDIKIRTNMSNSGKRTMLHIKGMDAITSKEEIMKAIVRETEAVRNR